MIKFDPTTIYNRVVDKLQQDPNWKVIINNSVVSALIKSNAEVNAETARYAEYLFKESRWDTAQNPSSVLSMANMMGYQPKRKISARGRLYVSLDPKTHLVGKAIPYDSFKKLAENNTITSSTSGWFANVYSPISINSSCTVTDSKGNSYIVTGAASLDSNYYATHVDIMQGVKKSVFIDIDTIRNTATFSKLDPYVYIPVKINNVENASNLSSAGFLKVYIVYPNKSDDNFDYTEYRVVESLLLSSAADHDCELYNDLYNQNLFYLKFNNDLYNGVVLDLSQNSSILGIRIDYVESLGAAGNVDNLFENFTLTDLKANDSMSIKLYGVNYTAINGGEDEESIASIKKNTVKSYTKYFSIGTKEAYEKAILNTQFNIDGIGIIKPKKVQVYGSLKDNIPVTKISFIGSGLEDLSSLSADINPYAKVTEALNTYLVRLKSPQDILEFEPPEYTSFAVGLDCTISNGASTELLSLQDSIVDYIDSQWGPNSNAIDFGNNFISSKLIKGVMDLYDDVTSVDVNVEAVAKLNWNNAKIIVTNADALTGDVSEEGVIHTCRIPFDFSSTFLGEETNRGFKDFRIGANYTMRIDVMYKKPLSLSNTQSLHKTIFIEDTRSIGDTTGFVAICNTNNIWASNVLEDGVKNYTDVSSVSKIDSTAVYQVDYEQSVLNDNSFLALKNNISIGKIATRLATTSAGALDNFIIYYSGDYTANSSGRIGSGWFEFTFDDIYSVLRTFSLYDANLASDLKKCPLYALKCGVANSKTFESFKNIVYKYVDIYVCMRPIDSDLVLNKASAINNYQMNRSKEVLYIDSYDTKVYDANNSVTNLTVDKRSRFIDVNCSYEDN